MMIQDLLEEAQRLNADGVISDEDLGQYLDVVLEALGVHIERERVRKGLWKEYPARDQNHMIVIKADRIKRSLEGNPTQAQVDNAVEENSDIINYAIFSTRKLKGLV